MFANIAYHAIYCLLIDHICCPRPAPTTLQQCMPRYLGHGGKGPRPAGLHLTPNGSDHDRRQHHHMGPECSYTKYIGEDTFCTQQYKYPSLLFWHCSSSISSSIDQLNLPEMNNLMHATIECLPPPPSPQSVALRGAPSAIQLANC